MAFKRSGVRFPSAPSAWYEGPVGYQSGQMEQTVNLPAYAYVGSNPTPTMFCFEQGGRIGVGILNCEL
jgi:hypothetical protein